MPPTKETRLRWEPGLVHRQNDVWRSSVGLRGGDSSDVPRAFLANSRAARGVGLKPPSRGPCYPGFASMNIKPRDLMAPDTEPTDEELALVMREARDLAVQRRATADAWVAARLKEASVFGRTNSQARRTSSSR